MDPAIQIWFEQYGYGGIGLFLMLSLMGLPFPDVTMLTTVGFLAGSGKLQFWLCAVSAFAGIVAGMTASYWIGRKAGEPLIMRYGKWIQLTPERFSKVENWFSRYGAWVIFFGYYVPGWRQTMNYVAGICRMPWPVYLASASAGAAVWVIVFLTAGAKLSAWIKPYLPAMEAYRHWLLPLLIGGILTVIVIVWLKLRRNKKMT